MRMLVTHIVLAYMLISCVFLFRLVKLLEGLHLRNQSEGYNLKHYENWKEAPVNAFFHCLNIHWSTAKLCNSVFF